MKIHHVGYLVKNIRRAIQEFEKLGFSVEKADSGKMGQPYGIVQDNIRGINIIFMLNGAYRIELVEPIDTESPIYNLLKKYKNCPYHICYYADDIQKKVSELEENGWVLFQPLEKAPAIHNKRVAFLMNASIGMIELVEE